MPFKIGCEVNRKSFESTLQPICQTCLLASKRKHRQEIIIYAMTGNTIDQNTRNNWITPNIFWRTEIELQIKSHQRQAKSLRAPQNLSTIESIQNLSDGNNNTLKQTGMSLTVQCQSPSNKVFVQAMVIVQKLRYAIFKSNGQ